MEVPNVSSNGSSRALARPLRTRGELEAGISRRFIQLEKSCTGRGPEETRTYLVDDLVLICLRGVLTHTEHQLAEVDQRGASLIKESRHALMRIKRAEVEAIILEFLDVGVRSVHTDISTRTGEHIVVVSLQRKPEMAVRPER